MNVVDISVCASRRAVAELVDWFGQREFFFVELMVARSGALPCA